MELIGLTVNVTAITAVGSTTALADNTKNRETNYWVGSRVRFMSGTSQGNEYIITGNTAYPVPQAVGAVAIVVIQPAAATLQKVSIMIYYYW